MKLGSNIAGLVSHSLSISLSLSLSSAFPPAPYTRMTDRSMENRLRQTHMHIYRYCRTFVNPKSSASAETSKEEGVRNSRSGLGLRFEGVLYKLKGLKGLRFQGSSLYRACRSSVLAFRSRGCLGVQ